MYVRYIPRHRLTKKDPSLPISDPIEPIVYYLDPGCARAGKKCIA